MVEEILAQASTEDKKVFIHYRKGNGELSERVIGGIISSEEYGEGYIEAFCYKQNDKRTYRVADHAADRPPANGGRNIRLSRHHLKAVPVDIISGQEQQHQKNPRAEQPDSGDLFFSIHGHNDSQCKQQQECHKV